MACTPIGIKEAQLLQLEKVDHGRLIDALDALIPFVGLWHDFHLGAMNRILPMRVWQVLTKSLQSVSWVDVNLPGNSPLSLTHATIMEGCHGGQRTVSADPTDGFDSPVAHANALHLGWQNDQ